MKTHDTLIPTRFMSSICFLVATIMVFSTMNENVLAALPANYSEADFRSNYTSFTFALALTLISLGMNLFGFMLGFSMFMPAVCVINIVSHTLGCIYTCVFIMQSWYGCFQQMHASPTLAHPVQRTHTQTRTCTLHASFYINWLHACKRSLHSSPRPLRRIHVITLPHET